MDVVTGRSSRLGHWRLRLATTLCAWLVAYLLVLALLTLFGKQLHDLPPAVDALIFTGLLVPVMGNLVMPMVIRVIGRRLAGKPDRSD